MDSTSRYGSSRAPLSTLSSGQTFFTVESLQGITTLPGLPFASSSSTTPAFATRQSLPIQRVGREIPSTHDDSLSSSLIRTHDLRDTMRGSIGDHYRQPITDRQPTMNMNYVSEPIREPTGRFLILNHNVAPFQQQELVHRLSPQPQFYAHRSRPQEIFKSKLSKNSDRGLHPKFSKKAQMDIPDTKDNSKAQRMPVRPGWCSLCDVDCNTKEVLHRQHVFGKKHQFMFEKLKEEASGDGKKPQMEQPQQLMGWCSLCDINCGSMENLHKQHMLGKKHKLMLGIGQDPQMEDQETPELDNRIENILVKRKQQIKEEGDMSSKKRQKLSKKRNVAQLKQHENPEAHLEVDGERKKEMDNRIENTLGKRKQQIKAEGTMSSKKRQKLSEKRSAAQLKQLENPDAHLEVDGESKKEMDNGIENSFGKRKQQIKEEGKMSSKKRQKLSKKKNDAQPKQLENPDAPLEVDGEPNKEMDNRIENSLGERKQQIKEEGNMSSKKRQKLPKKRNAAQLKQLENPEAHSEVDVEPNKEMENRIENTLGKRKQQIKEEGNMSSKKRQKLSEKRSAAQLKQLENPDAHLEVDGESKKEMDSGIENSFGKRKQQIKEEGKMPSKKRQKLSKKKNDAQLKQLENPDAPLEVDGEPNKEMDNRIENSLGKRKQKIKEEGNMSSQKRQKLSEKRNAAQLNQLENPEAHLEVDDECKKEMDNGIENSLGKRKKQIKEEGNMSSKKRQKLPKKRNAAQLKQLENPEAHSEVDVEPNKEMENRIENTLGKRKQQIKEEGNMSSKKRQKLSEKRNAAQLKQLENPEAHLEVDGESKKCADVDGQDAKNSELLVLAKDDSQSPGQEEETIWEIKDDSKKIAKPNEVDSKEIAEPNEVDSKKIAEPNEVDGKKENVTGAKFEEVAISHNV